MKTVAVIGSGASGLAATKCCLEEGLLPMCFERTDDIGGLWNYTEAVREGQGCVMKSTYTNTSKEMSCFSDFPMPREFPMYLHNTLLLKYFRMYVEKFDLQKYIKFNTEVLKVKPTDKFDETGQWELTFQKRSPGKPVTTETQVFDNVMVCTGHYVDKFIPNFAGLSTFKGTVVHTRDVKDVRGFEGKKVVVVGLGNSAADAAVELSHVASQVYTSTRSGRWFVSRTQVGGLPIDMAFFQRYKKLAPWKLRVAGARQLLNSHLNHYLYSFAPDHEPLSVIPTVNDEFPTKVAFGKIIVKPDIKQINGGSVTFSDGTVVEDVDFLLCGTGYNFGFPYLDKSVVGMEENHTDLYKFIFPPELKHSSLALIGCVVAGPIIVVMEIQSRLAVRVFKGLVNLPSTEERWQEIRQTRKINQSRYKDSKGHFIQIDFVEYMDDIASMIGCKPNIGRLFLTDPKLAYHCLFGPFTAYQFRLQGPGKWSGARDAIFTQWQRTFYPQKSRTITHKKEAKFLWPKFVFALAAVTLAILFLQK